MCSQKFILIWKGFDQKIVLFPYLNTIYRTNSYIIWQFLKNVKNGNENNKHTEQQEIRVGRRKLDPWSRGIILLLLVMSTSLSIGGTPKSISLI